jgi:putative hydrolase of the HAD superfamily
MAGWGVKLQAVLFDVDFTLAKPGPLLGAEGYRDAGRRHGLDLDPERYPEARAAALLDLQHHPELDHDEEVWIRFTEDIVRGMGGEGESCRRVAVAITDGWLESENFELYEDVVPVLGALREAGLKIGLVSNTSRDLDTFVRHHALDVDAWVSSGVHGKVKPSPSIFRAVLDLLEVEAEAAVMVGDSPEDDVAGAEAIGMRGLLLDREGKHGREDVLPTLLALPALLGIEARAS